MILQTCIWLAIALVITLRSLAVYSRHFVDDAGNNLKSRTLGWFRLYKRGFRLTLGLVAFFLAAVALLDGSIPWTIGNFVFGCAAFINFQHPSSRKLFNPLRTLFQSKLGAFLLFWLIPAALVLGLSVSQLVAGGQALDGTPFSYTGAYLLALIFLAMKLETWGEKSYETYAYLLGVLTWDSFLLLGALLDDNLPFMVLESYALLLDSYTLYLVKAKPLVRQHLTH
jgi:hypothetical protein